MHFNGYGMIQDQISVRVCPAYFTIGHPPIQAITNPTLLGILWGFLGGFPGGIVLGIPLAVCMYLGRKAPFPLHKLNILIHIVLIGTAFGTIVTGLSSWYNTHVVNIAVGAPWNTLIPNESHRRFFIVANAHFGTYLSSTLVSIGMYGWIGYQRMAVHE